MNRKFTKYPNSYVKASDDFNGIDIAKPLGHFSEEQINSLPDKFCVRTRIPGGDYGYKYKIITKSDYIKDPEHCIIINTYWGYAYPSDIYLVTQEQLRDYKDKQLKQLEQEKQKILNKIQEYSYYTVL